MDAQKKSEHIALLRLTAGPNKLEQNGELDSDNSNSNERNQNFKFENEMIEFLKSSKNNCNNPLFKLNINGSTGLINVDWWKAGSVNYGFKIENNNIITTSDVTKKANPDPTEFCPICLDNLLNDVVALNGCHHKFHNNCIIEYKNKRKNRKLNFVCPLCFIISLPGSGPSPSGTMSWKLSNKHFILNNDNMFGILKINYNIKPGYQMKCHPHPGYTHMGGKFKAYLPLTDEFIELLNLFVLAFLDGHTFTIRTMNSKRSQTDIVLWNIEHLTKPYETQCNFEYPEPNFLERVSKQMINLLRSDSQKAK